MSDKVEKPPVDDRITVAGKVPAELWDKCIERGFRESRARTNSAVVIAALEAYAAG